MWPYECAANQQFNRKKVEQELKRYRKKGPGPTTRLLLDGISPSGALAGTVLDVGSGSGPHPCAPGACRVERRREFVAALLDK
jgi:hypothetical protein